MLQNRLNSLLPARALSSGIDRVLEDFWRTFPSLPADGATYFFGQPAFPAINVWESENALHAELELPGLSMQDLEVSVKDSELSIKGEFKDKAAKGATYHRRERSQGSFQRVLRLPVGVDADKVEARLENGVLSIDLPKAEAAKARKIEIKRLDR
jgi:HSP20 family protein